MYQIPTREGMDTLDFEPEMQPIEIYEELNAIAEEIEKCRLENT